MSTCVVGGGGGAALLHRKKPLLPEKGRSPAEQTKQVWTAGLGSLRAVDAVLCMLCTEEREARQRWSWRMVQTV